MYVYEPIEPRPVTYRQTDRTVVPDSEITSYVLVVIEMRYLAGIAARVLEILDKLLADVMKQRRE